MIGPLDVAAWWLAFSLLALGLSLAAVQLWGRR